MEGTSSSVRVVRVISGKPERTCEEEGLFLSENRHLSNRLEFSSKQCLYSCIVIVIKNNIDDM